MFNTTAMISQMVSQTQTNTNSVQDINPISEELQKMIISFKERFKQGTELGYNNTDCLCRCANCGFLSIATEFGRTSSSSGRVYDIEGCPRCSSKAIFLETKNKKEEK